MWGVAWDNSRSRLSLVDMLCSPPFQAQMQHCSFDQGRQTQHKIEREAHSKVNVQQSLRCAYPAIKQRFAAWQSPSARFVRAPCPRGPTPTFVLTGFLSYRVLEQYTGAVDFPRVRSEVYLFDQNRPSTWAIQKANDAGAISHVTPINSPCSCLPDSRPGNGGACRVLVASHSSGSRP